MPENSTETLIYHNPRCSKSRQTLSLLEENGIQARVVEYLKTPPSTAELETILQRLQIEPRDLMRRKEQIYGELNLDDPSLDRDALIKAMVENPQLIERPIVLNRDRAALGRPPENVLTILQGD